MEDGGRFFISVRVNIMAGIIHMSVEPESAVQIVQKRK